MLICIVGNISVGKSTTCMGLEKSQRGFKYFSLDIERKKHNKKMDVDGEDKAQYSLIKKIASRKNVIIECTGTGKWFDRYISEYKHSHPKEKIFVVRLEAPVLLAKKRTIKKIKSGYEWPPLPKEWGEWFGTSHLSLEDNLMRSIEWMNKKIPRGDISIDTAKMKPHEVVEEICKQVNLKK